MVKDINIHVKTPGSDQAKRNLDDIGQSAKKAGQDAASGGRQGSAEVEKLSASAEKGQSSFRRFSSSIGSWLTGLFGVSAVIAGITRAIRANIQAVREHAQIVEQQQTKLMNLQYLGDMFKEKPELKAEVQAYAEYGARPFGEVAEAWYNIRSKGGALPAAQRQGILMEALELGRTEPNASLVGLADAMLLYAKQTGTSDPNVIQNIMKQTLTEAGSDVTGLGQFLPRFLPIGTKGGLTGAESAGVWAFATGQLGSAAEATTALRNTFLSLQGRGTPQSAELLTSLGITPEQTFWQKIGALSSAQAAGKFGAPEAEMIAGREGMAMLLSMVSDPASMMATVSSVTGAARPDIDLTARAIEGLMGADPAARMAEQSRRMDIAIENIKGSDVVALERELFIQGYEKWMREQGKPEYLIQWEKTKQRLLQGFGWDRVFNPRSVSGYRHEEDGFFSENNPVIINNYNNDIINNPVVGGEDDRGQRPRVLPGEQP